ncbi:hypothetical protein [Delftia acidovorans]
MSNHILFVFEGEKAEERIWRSLQDHHFNDVRNAVICTAYCCEIYSLFHQVLRDPEIDIFPIVKEIEINKEKLKDISRVNVSEIYLFFDYDGHSSTADDEKLGSMLDFFNEETGRGKLYINYPMVESFKHLGENIKFHELSVNCRNNINYKNIVNLEGCNSYKDLRKFDKNKWSKVIEAHCFKSNLIVNNKFEFPANPSTQKDIFKNQCEKFILPKNEVSVLNSFPLFLLDYFGSSKLKNRIEIV